MDIITVKNLSKDYIVNKREPGIKGLLKSIILPRKERIQAVNNINFNIKKGEIVGLIGLNGAGKSTTIKMLTGILYPSSGKVIVNNKEPYKNRKENASNIGVVLGSKSQLWWNIPLIQSFSVLKSIYRISDNDYNNNIKNFCEILDIKKYINSPVRELSLGQRMRAEIASSLLHNPEILYLDEPTIGLDVIAKESIRKFIKENNKINNTTVILTTHDMNDIEELCDRIIIMDKGKIIYDGSIYSLRNQFKYSGFISVELDKEISDFYIDKNVFITNSGTRKQIYYNKQEIASIDIINDISSKYSVTDISIKEIDLEYIIKNIHKRV